MQHIRYILLVFFSGYTDEIVTHMLNLKSSSIFAGYDLGGCNDFWMFCPWERCVQEGEMDCMQAASCSFRHDNIPISGGCIMMSRNPNAASVLSDLFWTCFWEPGTFAKDLVEAPESLKTLPQFFMDATESPKTTM